MHISNSIAKSCQPLFLSVLLFALLMSQGSCIFKTEEMYSETGPGEQKEIKLPDGSMVLLNAKTELGWSPGKWTKSRHVTLDGEANFKTKKGKKFIVKTELGTVEVMGTTFNVYARKDVLEVKCLEGKVQVNNTEGKQKVLLKKGEEVNVEGGWMGKRQKLSFYPAWDKGESRFREVPLERVLDEVERQYGVRVFADSIENKSYKGKFSHKSLTDAMAGICRSQSLKFNIQGDTVNVFH